MRRLVLSLLTVPLLAAALPAGSAGESQPATASRPMTGSLPPGFANTLVASLPAPTAVAFAPGGRVLVTTQGGRLHVVRNGSLQPRPALDLGPRSCTNGERGLLGVAVDPGFASNGWIYLYWTRNATGSCTVRRAPFPENRISRFTLGGDERVAPTSERVIADNIPSPGASHNGGDLNVGGDGLLYASVGDGFCDLRNFSRCAESNGNARRLDIPLGKILRLTRTGGIPAGNPYAGKSGGRRCTAPSGVQPGSGPCTEIFASGLRNPFRFAFRPGTSSFFINDVGQNAWEEIDSGRAGADYGWNLREGPCVTGSTTSCGPSPFAAPVHAYSHDATGCRSITGGAFVPSGVWPAGYGGSYLFADFVCGKIFRLVPRAGGYSRETFASGLGGGSAVHLEFTPAGMPPALYYTTYEGGGQVRRITRTG